MSNLFTAIDFAAHAHHGQFRKASPLPYIIHPLNVARILIECGASEEVVVAAVLHDVVEDTPVTLHEVREQFGENIARLVGGMTEPNRKDKWEKRKQDMLDLFETASQDLLLLELADRLDNIREIRRDLERDGARVWERFTRGYDQQKWVYLQFLDLFRRRLETTCGKQLIEEFDTNIRVVFDV
ncbi:MAG: bifunctional (p)ppGpp synthetase/guanosine-3',5'-bis(diphosphate) 3'-pyrophosphohydrolase [Anaerolineae bacterium]|nr:bifunctional (p)ppGpp synthetase/guanosine-3',5'-bis(diphosphate) 3'-pyrophosphohydrolase [Anaerolineae bacterium]